MLIDDRHPLRPRRRKGTAVVIGAMLGLLGFAIAGQLPSAAEAPRLVPAALVDVPKEGGLQTAVLAGGCFWGIQGVFQQVEGVVSATSGYAGGSAETATVTRLRTATERGTVGRTATDLAAAFEYLQELRLRHQAGQLQAAAAPDDLVLLADLGALERRWLKDAFHLLHTCQEGVRIAFQADLIA